MESSPAADIITYIGVPLAVIGVLPILYTSAIGIINSRRIRRALLRHGHKAITSAKDQDGFTIRSSPMTTLIEVELPKYAIAPLERDAERYWQLSHEADGSERGSSHLLERADSTLSTIEEGRVEGFLRGGSWRAFHWKRLIVGKKLYRIQYEDELREPPAEVDFADLIHFLLDWGAELDPMGWEKLRSGGLWTPAGTVLLRLPDNNSDNKKVHREWILRTVMPDDSDGILTLCIKWPHSCTDNESTRGAVSLPPGWGRLTQPVVAIADTKGDDAAETSQKSDKPDIPTRIEALKSSNEAAKPSTSMRFKADASMIKKVYWENSGAETSLSTTLDHLHDPKIPLAESWFTAAVSSLLIAHPSATSGALWGFDFPVEISNFSRKDTIPVGIMVLLNILPDDKAPEWTSCPASGDPYFIDHQEHNSRFQARLAAERLEATMPAEQARAARDVRQMRQIREQMDDHTNLFNRRAQRQQQRFVDALASTKMDNKAVAELCLAWLIANHELPTEYTFHSAIEAILYLFVLETPSITTTTSATTDGEPPEESQTFIILHIIEEWNRWANAGGMMKQQFEHLQKYTREFCMAACIVAIVREGALGSLGQGGQATQGKASVDMIECLDMWRKVRLG